jgi:3-oxoacyl-[acyl-carrier protein] reductase
MTAPARRVLVTGGASGIGGAIVERLAGQGFAVEFTYHRAASEAAKLSERFGIGAQGRACDLADGDAVESLARSIEATEPYYGLVHNAGVTADALAALVDRAAAERVFAVNFWAMVRLVRACCGRCRRRGKAASCWSARSPPRAGLRAIRSMRRARRRWRDI